MKKNISGSLYLKAPLYIFIPSLGSIKYFFSCIALTCVLTCATAEWREAVAAGRTSSHQEDYRNNHTGSQDYGNRDVRHVLHLAVQWQWHALERLHGRWGLSIQGETTLKTRTTKCTSWEGEKKKLKRNKSL